jgi:hypothetical protein
MGSLTTLGGASKTVFLTTEAHKTTIEATASAAIKKGQPIKLTATGQAAIWAVADGIDALIGYAYADCASGELTTIWSRGYAIIYGISNASQNAGPVKYTSYDTADAVGGLTGYSKYSAATVGTDAVNGWALDNATAANQLIRILLQD